MRACIDSVRYILHTYSVHYHVELFNPGLAGVLLTEYHAIMKANEKKENKKDKGEKERENLILSSSLLLLSIIRDLKSS